MSKFLKRFETHSAYNTYINGQGRILPNVSYCRDNNDVHYNPVPKITIEFTLSEANEERIAIKGDLTSLQGFRDDVDGFENVTAIKIDGQEVSKTNDFTEKNVLNNYGIVIDGYFYDFTTSGTHTIEYELNSLTLPQGLLNLLGNYNYYGIVFSSKMTQISVSLNGINEIETNALTINSINEVIFDKNIKNITSFSDYIFSDCTSLTSVIMPNNVTSIGANAFQYCTSLTNITIPNSVTSIGSDAFSTCTSLTTVTLNSDAIVSQTYTHYSNFINIFGSQVSTYIFGKDVTSIGNYAFDGCTGLTNINIPNSVTSIGQSAFKSCSGITSITIPNSVTSIGSEAFSNCTGLTNVTMSDSVTSIGNYVFNQCSNLTSITIPNSVTTIGNYAFNNCSSLTSITIPSSVTSIGAHAFEYCTGLTSVTMSDGVTSIGSDAFKDCTGLISMTIPNTITSIGYGVFTDCTGLTSVTIPNSVTSIGNYAFQNCTGLTSITIPSSVTSIGVWAFYDCSSLGGVTVEATTPPTLDALVFYNNASGRKIYVPSESVNTYKAANGWSDYASDIEAIPST